MNDLRRKQIKTIIAQFNLLKETSESLQSDISNLKDKEQDCFDNMPESLQDGDKGQKISDNVDKMQTAEEYALEIADAIDNLIDQLNEAIEKG